MWKTINSKLKGTIVRFLDVFQRLPVRVKRVFVHLMNGLQGKKDFKSDEQLSGPFFLNWLISLFFLLADVIGIPEVYETAMDWWKWRTRPLTKEELALARTIFGNTLNYQRIRIDENSRIACKTQGIFYVSFYTINSWGTMRPEIFIHELVHVWQFEKMGSIYIPKALMAQRTRMGYNYGGLPELRCKRRQQIGLEGFNLEQQADIVADYFSLCHGLMPKWSFVTGEDWQGEFEFFIKEIQR